MDEEFDLLDDAEFMEKEVVVPKDGTLHGALQ